MKKRKKRIIKEKTVEKIRNTLCFLGVTVIEGKTFYTRPIFGTVVYGNGTYGMGEHSFTLIVAQVIYLRSTWFLSQLGVQK